MFSKLKKHLEYFILPLLLIVTLIDFDLLNKYLIEREFFFVLVISLWSIYRAFFFRIKKISLSIYDIGFSTFFILFNINFFLLSKTTLWYSRYNVFVAYFVFFYLLKWYFADKKNKSHLSVVLNTLFFLCVYQSTIALLQYTNFIKVSNPYFKLLGSFLSPNYLALYVSLGVLIVIWKFIYNRKRNLIFFLLIFCLVLFFTIIVLSDSRGTYLSLILSSIILVSISSYEERINLINLIRINKIKSILVIFCISILFYFLYNKDVNSLNGRRLIAKISLENILEKPVYGSGAYNFVGEYNLRKSEYFNLKNRDWNEIKVGNYVFSSLNDYLLIAYEYGLPILFLFLSLIIVIFLKVKLNRETIISIAIVTNILIWSFFNSSLSNLSITSVGVLFFSVVLIFGKFNVVNIIRVNYRIPIFNLIFLSVGMFGCFISFEKFFSSLEIESYYNNTNKNFNKQKFLENGKKLENNSSNDFRLGLELYRNGLKDEGFILMEKSFDKSAHPRIGRNLASLYIKEDNLNKAEEKYRINMGLEPFRYQPKMDLISLMRRKCNYKEVLKLSEIVKNFPTKIESSQVIEFKEIAKQNIILYKN